MAIDDLDVVDIISTDRAGNVVLTISDHLDWMESASHQRILQQKLNRYLTFVESGEILERYPGAKGRPVIISVVTRHEPDGSGVQFLERAKVVIEQAGFTFEHMHFDPPSSRI